ncbi:melatonin receptor type 1B-A-like [Asterias amurensis]|uniref:melatonin receptor type 1B-A-like n=1 Tax=Asterias amurensis TaxID=7602 RepID=UPI003AB6FECE
MENYSHSGLDEEQPASSLLERQILAGVLALVAVLGIVGNTVVIVSVFLSYKLRTKMNIFVVNLSFSDFLICLHLVWIIVAFVADDGWPLPDWLCVWCGFILITCIGVSVYTLACIAVNRLILIRYSQATFLFLCRPTIVCFMLVIIWVVPLCVSVTPLITDLGELGYSSRYRTCLKNNAHERAKAYDVMLSLVFYPLPTAIIITCYLKIFVFLRSRVKKVAPENIEPTVSSVIQPHQEERPNLRERLDRRQVKVTKNMFYVVCLFFMCTTPYGLSLLCTHPACLRATTYAAVILSCNSCINPFIYATKHPDFKKVIRCILLCKLKKIPQRVKLPWE